MQMAENATKFSASPMLSNHSKVGFYFRFSQSIQRSPSAMKIRRSS